MADKQAAKKYDSIIDSFLDMREPDYADLDLGDAKKSGDEQLDRTHQYVDKDFMDEIAESASRHTPIWGEKAGNVLEERIAEKEAAAPRIHSIQANRYMEDYKSPEGDNDSLMNEVCESLDAAYKNNNLSENSADKKSVTDEKILSEVKEMLKQGATIAKVTTWLTKHAELELFNHQSATDYLQRNAGFLGLAYLEPNTYMDKNSPTYERTAGMKPDLGGAKCVAQKRAWDKAGIKQAVNNLTPGVPNNQKVAALKKIANGTGDRAETAAEILAVTGIIKTADAKVSNQEKRASYEFNDVREVSKHFSSEHVEKMHAKGASLQQIYKWASEKFGDVDASMAFRGFVQSLKKNTAGKIVLVASDVKFLNQLGIRNASFEGKEKCASCPIHFNREARPEQSTTMRVEANYSQRTPDALRSKQASAKEVVVTPAKVRTLHQAGHSISKIYNGAASKVGSVQAKKAVAGYVDDFKRNPGKIAFNEQDRAFLVGKLGFKPESVRLLDPQRRPVTQVVANVPDDAVTMKYASEAKATDGHAILAEYDLASAHEMQDIDTSGPQRDDIEVNSTFRLEE